MRCINIESVNLIHLTSATQYHLIVFTFVCVFNGRVKRLNDGILNEGKLMFDV